MFETLIEKKLRTFSLSVSFLLPKNAVVAVIGPSGSGKSSLLRSLAGFEVATGFVKCGRQIWMDSKKKLFIPANQRKIGYVFQQPYLFPFLDVEKNLRYGYDRLPQDQRKIPLEKVISALELRHILRAKPGQLSGGEAQKICLARALLQSPDVLFLDEALGSMDLEVKVGVLQFLKEIFSKEQQPVFYVSHSPEETLYLADYVLTLKKGRVDFFGAMSEAKKTLKLVPLASELLV